MKNKSKSLIDRVTKKIPDKLFLQVKYFYHMKRILKISNPITFSEKIQWLKLNERNPLYTNLVDKYMVRSYVGKKIGEDYLIPLIAVYESAKEIKWYNLPNEFVIKCTHGSHCHIICKDKSSFDILGAEKEINKWLNKNWYWYGREWPYKNVKPRIIVEEFIKTSTYMDSLIDYKMYCFHGKPTYCQVIQHGASGETINFFDENWVEMDFTGLKKTSKKSEYNIRKPNNFEEMKKIATQLSEEFSFVRVDLYNVEDKIFFGELTFYPQSGFGQFKPSIWNRKIGSLLDLGR